jgi:OmpA-OmpF porin, OOP family
MGTMKNILSLLILWFVLSSIAEVDAQEYHFTVPQPIGTEVNSDSEESLPLYSPSDSTLYFVRTLYRRNTGGMLAGQDIWYSKQLSDNEWSAPVNDLYALNNQGNNAVVGISKTGNTLYLLNSYKSSNSREAGLAFAFNRNQTWTDPADISVSELETKQGNFYGYYVNPAETILFISMQAENSLGQEDLYVSIKNPASGTWSTPTHLGPKINTQGYEISPFLSEDGKTLYFASSGHPGFGDADIFAATRLDAGWTNWSTPVNLGESINSPAFDAYFSIAPDQKVYFVSSRNQKSADIYTAQMLSGDALNSLALNKNGFTLTEEERELNAETIALIEETKTLLEEFNRAKAGKTGNDIQNTEALPAPHSIYFALNSAQIETDSTALKEIVNELNIQKKLHVEIVGHADDLGNSDYNLKLSINRALSVKEYLLQQGISEERIITYGKGETAPAAPGNSEESRKLNRRVSIAFLRL